jgi:2'-5' RNA ligase
MPLVRVFVAVSISEEARAAIASMMKELKRLGERIRWIPPENLHLTLKFVGEVDSQRVPEFESALDRSIDGFSQFQYSLEAKGCFPNWNQPRILWVGVKDTEDRLVGIHREIDRNFQTLEIPNENRRFKPHLTIARLKQGAKPEAALSAFQRFQLGEYRVDVREVHLMRSDLGPSGAQYSILHSASLHSPYSETVGH